MNDSGADSEQPAPHLSVAHQRRLTRVADAMIPATDEMPAPSSVGVASSRLGLVLGLRPDLAEPLARALDAIDPDRPLEALDRLRVSDPQAHESLVLVVLGGYYLSEQVTALLGYPGQQAEPIRPDTYPPYVEEGLLDAVLEGGPRYRPVPGE